MDKTEYKVRYHWINLLQKVFYFEPSFKVNLRLNLTIPKFKYRLKYVKANAQNEQDNQLVISCWNLENKMYERSRHSLPKKKKTQSMILISIKPTSYI